MRHLTKLSILVIFASTSFLSGCIGLQSISKISGLSSDVLVGIPKGSKSVLVSKENISADSLYEELFSILLSRGHRILKDDKARHYITTEGNDVGQSTLQRMTIVVTQQSNNCVAKITTEWKAGTEATAMATSMSGIPIQSDWAQASWENSRLGIAFAESVAIANEVDNGRISYK